MNALTIFTGKPTQASLDKTRNDRAAAERHIAELETARMSKLVETDDVAAVDQIDADVAAERRRIVICDQRIAALEKDLRRQARAEREAQRRAALKVIAAKFGKRQAKARELEAALLGVAELFNDLSDDRDIRRAWPFGASLPNYFRWGCSALQWESVRTMARLCRDMLPPEVRGVIGRSQAGDGVMRAPVPRGPDGVAAVYAAHVAHAVDFLGKVNIHLPGDDADDEEAAA